MVGKKQAGFSLIEVTIVLAITAALLVVVLQGLGVQRGQEQFRSSIDTLQQSILERRTEAQTAIDNYNGAGADVNNVAFGRMIAFSDNSSTYTVYTLKLKNTPNPDSSEPVYATSSANITMKWGISFVSATGGVHCIAFTQAPVNAALHTTFMTSCPIQGSSMPYSVFTPSTSLTHFTFTDPSARQAMIDIDPNNNTVTSTLP